MLLGSSQESLLALGLVSPSVKWAVSMSHSIYSHRLSHTLMTVPSLTMLGPQARPSLYCPPVVGPSTTHWSCSSTGGGGVISGPAPWITPLPGKELTLLELVPDHSEEGHGDHEQVGQETGLTQLPHGGAT